MKKKIVSLILAFTMTIPVLLTGCSTPEEKSDNAAATSKETAAAADSDSTDSDSTGKLFADEETYTLKIPYITTDSEPADLGKIAEKISEITMEEINCDVEFVTLNLSDLSTKYNMWLANGEKVDIIPTVFMDYVSMLNADAFVELDDLIEEYGKGLLTKNEETGFLNAGVYKGKQYGVPTIPAAPGNGGAIYIRTDVLEQLDLSDIDIEDYIGYEELDSILCQISEKCPEYIPNGASGTVAESGYFLMKNYDDLGVSGASCGVLMNPMEDTTIENLFATDEYKEYLTWMRKWYQEGYISKDAAVSSETSSTMLEAGRVALIFNMSTAGTMEEAEASTGIDLTHINLCPNYLTTRVYTGVMFFVPQNSEKPERAVAFLDMLFNDARINNLLTHGIEGEHYTLQENGVIVEYTENRDRYRNTLGIWGDQAQGYIAEPKTLDLLEERKEYLRVTMEHTSKANGYQFDMTEVATEQSAVKNVLSQYLTQLEYGTVDVEVVYPEFIKALEDAGINKIIEENQKQLDAWLAIQE